MKPITTAKQFDALGLPDTKTTLAMRLHLVKGESKLNAAAKAGIAFQVLYRALKDLPTRKCPTCGAIRSLTPRARERRSARA